MHVAVDQTRSQRDAVRIDRRSRTRSVDVLLSTDGHNTIAHRNYSVRIENRLVKIAAQQQSNIADDHLRLRNSLRSFPMSHAILPDWRDFYSTRMLKASNAVRTKWYPLTSFFGKWMCSRTSCFPAANSMFPARRNCCPTSAS